MQKSAFINVNIRWVKALFKMPGVIVVKPASCTCILPTLKKAIKI
jgi:hypothetical protein